MESGLIVGYCIEHREARVACKQLRQQGYRRIAWLRNGRNGNSRVGDPFPLRRLVTAGAAFLLGAAAGALLFWQVFHADAPLFSLLSILILPLAVGGIIGILPILIRPRFGITRRLLAEQARRLVADETAVLIQAPPQRLRAAFSLLQESGETAPAVFLLHPARVEQAVHGTGQEAAAADGEPLAPAQLQEAARRLAVSHHLDSRPLANAALLGRLKRCKERIQAACVDLADAGHLQQGLPSTAEWLLDNEYIMESSSRDVRLNLPWRFYRQLPALAGEPDHGLPRIYGLARSLVAHTGLRLDEENIRSFIEAYQETCPLSIGELWAVPQMLRLVLIEGIDRLADRALQELREREIAGYWANRLITASRRNANRLYSIMAELAGSLPDPHPYFASQLCGRLYDEGAVLSLLQGWLERNFGQQPQETLQRERTRRTKDTISISNAFGSLRRLAEFDWKDCFERLSKVEGILRLDPSGTYPGMDFATRDRYRRAVEDLHRGSRLSEEQVARRVVEMAAGAQADPSPAEGPVHIGHFLIGEGRPLLAQRIGCRERLRFRLLHLAEKHHTMVYALGLTGFTTALLMPAIHYGVPDLAPAAQLLFAVLLLIPASQLALDILNKLIIRFFPPRPLAKMDFRKTGIPDSCLTLIVVPMMLSDRKTVEKEIEKLEIRFLANKEGNLLFSLYPDYPDAATADCPGDAALLQTAVEGIEALALRHSDGRFFLFHRGRRWSASEGKFIGWERKRGKLEELNDLIVGTRSPNAENLVRVGAAEQLCDVRYVITLDSDTRLPADAARRLIETLAHPQNQARLDGRNRVRSGYSIIQPRVSPTLPSTSGSPFSRLFSYPVGIDPYTNTVSDVYQDLTGAGSYHGKGIYDVRAFSQVLSGRFPEARLLSHDLIEGAHVRVGLASDIELFDEFPQEYLSFLKRQHRWIRGDWQIAAWCLPRVPGADGKWCANPLAWFDRFKIFDNLRRSLLPAANLGLLIAGWIISAPAAGIAGVLVAAQLLFHSLLHPISWMTTRRGRSAAPLSRTARDLMRVMAEASMLPYLAWQGLDAMIRVWYRRHISRRGLLEWTSAQTMEGKARSKVPRFLLSVGLAGAGSLVAGWALARLYPAHLGIAAAWLALWSMAPLTGWLLVRRPPAPAPQARLPETDRRFLRRVARRTWRYFTDFVNESTSWLPPDNYQIAYGIGPAWRTSPTNIGLYLASILSAHAFGYLTLDGLVQRLAHTMETIGKLQQHEGHLLNWYDIRTLEPLAPRYVSTVDSGNLLGSLWTLARGLETLGEAPLVDAFVLAGLLDTGSILRETMHAEKVTGPEVLFLENMLHEWESRSNPADQTPPGLLSMLRQNESRMAMGLPAGRGETADWTAETRRHLAAWRENTDRYLPWLSILAEKPDAEIGPLFPEALPLFHAALRQMPSLRSLAAGDTPCAVFLAALKSTPSSVSPETGEWIARLDSAFDRAKWLAAEQLAALTQLIRDCDRLADGINMRFLYNEERRLFSIGFNVSEGRLDHSFYDLLASEARLGSFIAIARGDIPVEHWFAMSRPYGAIGRRRALLSWTGTMFEYMMPLLFQRSWDHTLLDKAARETVAIQIDYGRKYGVPWGISECAHADLDSGRTYQYLAFGVPELGLKRGLAEKTVVAPYATLLALPVAPRAAVANLKRLAAAGLLAGYGFYESLDFSRQSDHGGAAGVIVRTWMAHHHGMALLALDNFLHDGKLQRHFHADARVRTMEALLHERIPHLPSLHQVALRERISSVGEVGEAKPSVSQFDTPHGKTPKTQLLSNGRYALLLTSAGGGYSRWGEFDITRWRADPTMDDCGAFWYIHDSDSGQLWCNTYHPTRGKTEGYCANFTLDRAAFRRVDGGIECGTEVIIAPEDDVEIRRMTLVNRSSDTRRLETTSYLELALATHAADRQHPAFNKLFLHTEALPEQQALLASRRLRSDGEEPVHVAHRITIGPAGKEAGAGPFLFDTDRRRFIGRGRTLANPMGATGEPGGNQGFVLDPILSLRHSLVLKPGDKTTISMVIAAGSSREQVLDLMEKYGDPHAIERAMDLAWAAAQLELRLLRVQPDDARRFQQLAGYLLYPSARLRCPAERILENRKGQAGLWAYAISGDLPIALVAIGETRDLGLVRQVLQAHDYWRRHGLAVDLVILNEEAGSYAQPVRDELDHMIRTHGSHAGLNQPGGVFLRNAALIPTDDLRLLHAAASVVLVAARGTLPRQLAASATDPPDLPEKLPARKTPRDPSAALPFMELSFFNSLGGFTTDGREYAIYLAPGIHTPAPWVNVIANPDFGTLVSETGAGFTWRGNSQRNRLTHWSNDPVTDPPCEAIYLRDEESGRFWNPTASPIREQTAYRARHGAGYSVFEHNSHGIEQELTVFVPMDDAGGAPLKLQRLVLRNDSDRVRTISLTYYVEWTLGEHRESSRPQVVTAWDEEAQAMLARNHYHPEYPEETAFAALGGPASSYTGDRTAFLGRNRSPGDPAAMKRIRLSRRTGAGLDPCAALQTILKLAPGERTVVTCLLGQAPSVAHVHELLRHYRSGTAGETALATTRAWWDMRLDTIRVRTPELAADIMINRWLLYQSLACRMWARSGSYQSGGAYGFRDQLQDAMAVLYAHPGQARAQILLAAGRQFSEGDVQHWWHPPGGAGIRSRISDDLLWLPFVVARYVEVTGDTGILEESVPFLEAPLLQQDQHEAFQTPAVSAERGTVFEHCRRALTHAGGVGERGLPLMGTGDWNDGMNLIGAGGKGESVWLAWFLIDILQSMATLSTLLDRPELARSYSQQRKQLVTRVEGSAWDGAWYQRATRDDGTTIGSAMNEEAKIDSLPQSWAALSGAADPQRTVAALASAWKHLVRKEDGLVLLFDPPFDKTTPSPGYIKGYPPGVRENGGQYTHAAVWLAMAMARSGDGTRATEILRLLNPIEHAREPESVWRYGVEPYVVAADVYSLPEHIGQGGWSWYTGSAAWMYRAWIEEILGFTLRGETLQINPVIPGWWDGFTIDYRHHEACYVIEVVNPDHRERGVLRIELDGKTVPDGIIPLERELVKHRVLVVMGGTA